jgi:type IV fimbrial biogenesis protein FimT
MSCLRNSLDRCTARTRQHGLTLPELLVSLAIGNSSAWSYGWMLFASDNREREADEALLQAGNPLSAGVILHASNYRNRIMYQPDGSSGGSNCSFTFCDARNTAEPRVVCLSNSGRLRLSYSRCDGSPIQCPQGG